MQLFTLGLVLLAISIVVALVLPHPTEWQMYIFRGLFGFSGAAIASEIPGFLQFESKFVSAGGALAVFVLIYLLNPPKLMKSIKSKPGEIGVQPFITLEQYEALLKRREKEVREELYKLSAKETERRVLLEQQLVAAEAREANLQAAYEEQKAKLAEAARALEDFKPDFAPVQLEEARESLGKGETAAAEALFRQVLARSTEQSAEAAYQLGILAEGRIDFAAAHEYLSKAAQLQPDNPLYLNAAGRIFRVLGRYAEAEPLLQRSLAILEKALGPEHPDVANSLHNLAELYRAQGRYAEAEPLLQRLRTLSKKAKKR